MGESWIGKVLWGRQEEAIPSNFDPICTLFLSTLPYVPKELTNYQLITIYMDIDVFNHMKRDNLTPYFKVVCYTNLDDREGKQAIY